MPWIQAPPQGCLLDGLQALKKPSPFLTTFLYSFLSIFEFHFGAQHSMELHKNRCQEASLPDFIFKLIWDWFSPRYLMPKASKINEINIRNYDSNYKLGFWQFTLKIYSIWKPLWLYFGINNPPASQQLAISGGTKNWSDFDIVFY